jgi:hypothetical protein
VTPTKIDWSWPWQRKRQRGIVGMTVAAGKKLLPGRKKSPRRTLAVLSAAALGVALSVGAVFYFRPHAAAPTAPAPSLAAPSLAAPPPPKAGEVGRGTRTHKDHRR